ncbi:unnamed protein product, partial [Nesidiocoris tenuis]
MIVLLGDASETVYVRPLATTRRGAADSQVDRSSTSVSSLIERADLTAALPTVTRSLNTQFCFS